jgi:hypothetical protein
MDSVKQPWMQGVRPMVSELLTVVASVKAMSDILKASLDLHTFNQVTAVLSKVNDDLMKAQGAALKAQAEQAQLTEEVRALKEQLAAIDRWEAVAQNYSLKAIVPDVFVYEYVGLSPETVPSHFACANCFERRVRSILQLTSIWTGGKTYTCPQCHTDFKMRDPDYEPPSIKQPRYGRQGWMSS